MDKYCIKDGYVSRLSNDFFDDTPFKDEWQDEVYELSHFLAVQQRLNYILDYGTGSGFKLMKYFNDFETVGIDLPKTVEYLKKTYPDKTWSSSQIPFFTDLLICADVVEHIPDPDELIEYIKGCKPKFIVISTPDRNLLKEYEQNGPPGNKAHCREWTFTEFESYISKHFEILKHYITNKEQATQVIVCKLKENQ